MFASRARTVMSLVEESPRWSNPLDSNRGHLILPQARTPERKQKFSHQGFD